MYGVFSVIFITCRVELAATGELFIGNFDSFHVHVYQFRALILNSHPCICFTSCTIISLRYSNFSKISNISF